VVAYWPERFYGHRTLGLMIRPSTKKDPKSDTKDPPDCQNLKNPNFNINIKYLPNGWEYLNSAKIGESGVENWIYLNYYRLLGPKAEWEKGRSMNLVRLSGGLLVNKTNG
jgi:hypothetical protein